jgi:transcriptional regulator with XRE-family HTH domain
MTVTQLIREELGLSQQDLAQHLLISLSQLAMYETAKRELPKGTSVKIAEIALFLNQRNNDLEAEKTNLENQNSQKRDFLDSLTKELEYQLIKEQRKLEVILKKYNQSLALHSFADHLQKKKNQDSPHPFLKKALSGIEKNSLAVQTKQLVKLEGVKRQLVYLKSL